MEDPRTVREPDRPGDPVRQPDFPFLAFRIAQHALTSEEAWGFLNEEVLQ